MGEPPKENVQAAFRIVGRVYVLKLSKIISGKRPDTLLHNRWLRMAYLT
jgi:ABC-type lipopolysaccharide export system ATPase subunit